MGNEGCKCFLIATPTTATSRVKMLLWDCQCALIAWRHTFCLHCGNGSSLLGCSVANTNRHSKTNGILIELWQHSLYGVCLVHICMCVCPCVCVCCVCLGICGYLCQTVQGGTCPFPLKYPKHELTIAPAIPHFIYANMSIASVWVCVGVCGRGRGSAVESLCCAMQNNNNLKCAMRFVVVMSVRSMMTINRIQLECFTLHQVRRLSNLQSGPGCRWGNYRQGHSQNKALKRLSNSNWIRFLFWYAW